MLRDIRTTSFCWQDKHTLKRLREYYSGERLKRRATALAVYLALTEIASDQYSQIMAETTHRAIWEATGTSETTVKTYLREFASIGLVGVERRKIHADISLPNVYTLLTPGSTDSPTPAVAAGEGGAVGGPTPAADGPLNEELTIKKEEESDSVWLRRMVMKYGEQRVVELAPRFIADGQLRRAALWGELARRVK